TRRASTRPANRLIHRWLSPRQPPAPGQISIGAGGQISVGANSYCYFPLHDPEKTNWQERKGPENRAALVACAGEGAARGVLAYIDGQVVGWCNAGPWSQFPMLRGFPQEDQDSIGVIFCFVVDPVHRGQGVATALLDAACEAFRAAGLKTAQAKPAKQAEGAAANHLGPLAMYLAAGFSVVAELPNGDVIVRKQLDPATPQGKA
ncbi:MAG: GNAT family N-acetyltransferase, partial [Burkholderiaceae bacterium]|nr:GNAT family N-acetyltransferase [Burkholderiaceae bacterium]